jgi:hypothetical protein
MKTYIAGLAVCNTGRRGAWSGLDFKVDGMVVNGVRVIGKFNVCFWPN